MGLPSFHRYRREKIFFFFFNIERGEIRKCAIDIGLQSQTADQVVGGGVREA